ncbi:MAG TPA: condensation domain-containing protein, partial [Pyrinomonadaceae bacterium]|nr:condensation domain-containing protein [Pyrinomonadaceae bacterium]
VAVELEGHGREELGAGVDVTRTVGWFTSIYPVVLAVKRESGYGERLKLVKEKLRAVPRRGVGYGLLRYLSADEQVRAQLREQGGAEVSFNYLGQFGQGINEASGWRVAPESSGAASSDQVRRKYLVEIDGRIRNGRLWMSWRFSRQVHRRETIEAVAGRFVAALRELIAHCQSPEAGGFTPSDFPLARDIRQEQLTQLMKAEEQLEDLYPLSPAQHGILFHSLYAPDSGVYLFVVSGALRGDVDTAAFVEAWQRVLARHTVLRTAFIWQNLDTPLQAVYRRVTLPVSQHDWRGLPEDEQQKSLEAFLREERRQGFDFTKAPLMRLALMRLSEHSYRYCWSFHTLLLDGWSTFQIFKEVFEYYEALQRGEELQLPPVRSYREYISWLQQQDLSAAETFWRRTLKGFSAPIQLGLDRPAADSLTVDDYGADQIRLSAELSAALQQLGRQQQLTLNTMVQGAWALLLSRYSGEQDVVFGATVSGRPAELAGVEQMIGPLINTLPVRVKVAGEEQVGVWLRQLQEQQAEMRQYEYSPLVEVQGWSEVPRGVPLFESILVFENYPMESPSQQAERNQPMRGAGGSGATNYPLTLVVIPDQQILQILFERRRFSQTSIRRMLMHLETLLEGMTNPNCRVGEVSLLSDEERDQVVRQWNKTAVEYPQAVYAELFAQQVERTPEAIAVNDGIERLTYAELNERAEQLGQRLAAQGIGPETVVGLMLSRGCGQVAAMLGTFKAGGAYVPLEPQQPVGRVR